jgi:hypothetical protein
VSFRIKKEDPVQKLLRIEKMRFIKDEELSPHFLDPVGAQVYYLLHNAEKYFGKEAREELEEVLLPRQRIRILSELQRLPLSTRLDLVVARRRKRGAKAKIQEKKLEELVERVVEEVVEEDVEEIVEGVDVDGDFEDSEIPI